MALFNFPFSQKRKQPSVSSPNLFSFSLVSSGERKKKSEEGKKRPWMLLFSRFSKCRPHLRDDGEEEDPSGWGWGGGRGGPSSPSPSNTAEINLVKKKEKYLRKCLLAFHRWGQNSHREQVFFPFFSSLYVDVVQGGSTVNWKQVYYETGSENWPQMLRQSLCRGNMHKYTRSADQREWTGCETEEDTSNLGVPIAIGAEVFS